MAENRTIVEGLYAAFAAGDIGKVLSGFDNNIVWIEAENFPYADGNPYKGPEAIAKGVFQRIGGEWDGWRPEVDTYYEAGETVIACGRYKGRHKGTGKEISAEFVHLWTLKAARVTAFRQYADTLQVSAAIKK